MDRWVCADSWVGGCNVFPRMDLKVWIWSLHRATGKDVDEMESG